MKKVFAFSIILFAFLNMQAQLKKGEKMLGATISISSEKTKYDGGVMSTKNFSAAFAPSIGFGIGANLIVGLEAGVSILEYENPTFPYEQETFLFMGGPFIRAFHEFNDKFGIYGQFNLSGAFGSVEDNSGESDISILSATFHPGLYFRPTRRFIIEADFGNIGYTHTKNEGSKTNRLQFSLTEALGVGFKIVF